MKYTRVSAAEMAHARAVVKARKEAREAKRSTLPWAKSVKVKASGSLWKWWAAKCDALWGRAVRARDRALYGDVCRIRKAAHCTGKNECGYHLVSKARGHAIRWHLPAGVAACGPCNKGEQTNRDLYAQHHDELFGREFMDALRAFSRSTLKFDVPGLKDLASHLKTVAQENHS